MASCASIVDCHLRGRPRQPLAPSMEAHDRIPIRTSDFPHSVHSVLSVVQSLSIVILTTDCTE